MSIDLFHTKPHKAMKVPDLLVISLTLAMLSMGCAKSIDAQTSPVAPTANKGFEQQLLDMLPILDGHHVLQIQYSTDQGPSKSLPLFRFFPRTDDPDGSRTIVCHGSGLSFARCCGAWLDLHPGRCLKVYNVDGTYYADDNCQ